MTNSRLDLITSLAKEFAFDLQHHPWFPYVLSIAFVLIATVARALLGLVGAHYPWLTYLVAVAASTAYGGFGPGIVTLLVGGVIGDALFIPPLGWPIFDEQRIVRLTFYLVTGSGIVLAAAVLKQQLHRALDRQEELEREIDRRHHVEKKLQESEELLKEANRRKDEFLATLSHELRSPLAPMANAIEIARLPSIDAARRTWALDIAERQLRQLSRIIDDLLELGRIVSGGLPLKKDVVSLQELVHRAVETVQSMFETKSHRLQVELPEEPFFVHVDPARLTQVMINLLTNAAKYTPSGGFIAVRITATARKVDLSVRDTGEGIESENLSQIFEMFRRVTSDKRESGLGIGLAFAKRVIELHEGTISAFSEGLGAGSEFVVSLPRHEAPIAVSASAATLISGEPSKRVLIVDDNHDAADTLAELLRACGHDACCLYEGRSAAKTSLEFRPDIAIVDIGLPDVDGYAVARMLRALESSRRFPLVALTGFGQEADRAAAQEAGFDFHFVKPLDLNVLSQLLDSIGATSMHNER